MSVQRETLETRIAGREQRLDILLLLEKMGIKSLRMKLLAGGLIHTAGSIALLCLAICYSLTAVAGSNVQLQQGLGEMYLPIVISGLVIFALFGLLVFVFSRNVSGSLALRRFDDRGRLEEQLAQVNEHLAQSRNESAHWQKQSELSKNQSERSGRMLAQSERQLARSEEQLAHISTLVRELKQSNTLLHSAVNMLPQSLFCKDLDGAYTFVNKAFCKRVNLPIDRIIGKTELDFFAKEVAGRNIAADKEVIETAQVSDTILNLTGPGGNELYLQMIRTPRYDASGEIAGTGGIFWDVTESKQAEEALARERDLLNALMDTSHDFIYFKDLQSRFLRINKAHAAIFGLSDPADAVGKSDSDFFTGDHAQVAYEDEQRIIRTGEPLIGIEERESWADREDTWVSTTKNPLYDRNGRIIGTFGITRDVTERKRAAELLDHSMAEFLEFASRVSEGNLTLRAEAGEHTLGQVARSVNKILDSFSAMLTDVKQLGLSLSSSATQILAAADEIATGTQHQTDETSNVTSSVEEMAASMSQVSKNAEASAEAARRALDKAGRGTRSVRDTSEAMAKINSAVEQTADKIRMLAKRSTEISDIMALINGIAAQTNLLALNAAIEAAHAGDAGLGFSVVAEEIRKLADRSVQATRDVGKVIKGIQSETGEAISAMENGMSEVRNGMVLAEESRDALEAIAAVLKPSTELAEEISVASEEQSRVTMNLARAMQTISSITMQASAGAHETAQIIQGMVGLSDKLNQSISQFKVSEDLGSRI